MMTMMIVVAVAVMVVVAVDYCCCCFGLEPLVVVDTAMRMIVVDSYVSLVYV